MKKALILLAVGFVSVSFADQKLAQQKGCMACHDLKVKKVGPSYADIAKKYADKPDAVDYLANKIKKGGAGVWGSIPMPPQNVSEIEAKQLAKWILDVISSPTSKK